MHGRVIEFPALAWVGESGGEVVGTGVLGFHGGCGWLFFDTGKPCGGAGLVAVRWARKLLQTAVALGVDRVHVTRDDRFATSEKLLRLLGFEKTDETFQNQEVWVWHSC